MTTTSTGDGAWTSVVGAVDISDDVVIAHDVTLDGNVDMTGELKINSGKSLTTTGSNHALTVDGDCIVEGTLTGNASAISIGSLRVDGTYSATSGTTIITSERSNGRAIDIVGTYTHNSGTLEIRTPADTDLRYPSSSSLNDLTINHASCIARPTGDNKPVIGGDLTITAGTFNTLDSDGGSSHALTVTGTTQVTGTLTCNASTISLGSGLTSGWGLDIQTNGTFTGGSGTHTIGSIFAASGGTKTITLSSGATTINSKNTSNGFTINLASGTTFNHGSGTVTMTYAGDTLNQLTGGTLAFNTFTYNASGRTLELRSAMSCAANLTITAGTLDTKSGTNNALTVTGDASVTGTLTGNASAISLGSLTIASGGTYSATSGTTTITSETSGGVAVANSGTFTHNSGTVSIETPASTFTSPISYNNLEINHASAVVKFTGTSGSTMTIGGNLTIKQGAFEADDGDENLTVTGDVTVGDGTGSANTAVLGHADDTSAMTFGSLTIASDGKYNATSGTTTITGDPGGYPNFGINIDGTFTHNSGTLKYTGGGGAFDLSGTGNLYNFEHAPTDTTFITNNTTIENNLTMTGANFQGANGNEDLTVKGIVTINSANKQLNSNGSSEHTFGFLQILDGTYKVQNDTGGFTKVGGIRNVGGTVTNSV